MTNEPFKILTPHKLIVKGQPYIFIMNIEKKMALTLKKAAEYHGINAVLINNASNMLNQPLPTHCSVYVSDKDYQTNTCVSRLCDTARQICEAYKQYLIKQGLCTENMDILDIYLGCEKELKGKKEG